MAEAALKAGACPTGRAIELQAPGRCPDGRRQRADVAPPWADGPPELTR